MPAARLLTIRDVIELPDDDHRYELVRGVLIRRRPSGMAVGRSRATIGARFVDYTDRHGGAATMCSGYEIEHDPDTVLAPDIGFVRPDRVAAAEGSYYVPFAPDVAVVIVGWPDIVPERLPTVRLYLDAGTRVALFAEMDKQAVTVEYVDGRTDVLRVGDTFDGGDVMPGFRLPVTDFFE
jgi:hypothetical protein